jgi:hypothetical protein
MWRLSQISSYSYPRVTVIQIDVHPVGKTRPTRHTLSTLSPCMALDHTYLMWSTESNISWVIESIEQNPCSWEKGLPIQSTARRLTDSRVHTQFLSRANQWSTGESQTSVNSRLLGLRGPYHERCQPMKHWRKPNMWSVHTILARGGQPISP